MQPRERIAVTGIGSVSALGFGHELGFRRLLAGERGLGPVTLFDAGDQKATLVGEVRGLSVADVAPKGQAEAWSRTDVLALLAARQALESAGVAPGSRLGLSVGGTTGGMHETELALFNSTHQVTDALRARRLVDYPLSTTALRLKETLGGVESSASVCSACSSGAIALALGAAWLLSGRETRVLAGGADGLCRMTLTGFNLLGAIDPAPCRPFDVQRAGLNLGEAGAFVVLELEASARRRGAPIWGWLSGWAIGAEAHHITHPEPSGERARRLMLEALACAGISPSELDYINAHGTGTVQNDAMEALAIERALGSESERVWVSSSKAQLGHTLGAAGALEAVLTLQALHEQCAPPTVGLENPERTTLRHVIGSGVSARLRSALSNSFGFGGTGCVLAFEAADEPARNPISLARAHFVITGSASASPVSVVKSSRAGEGQSNPSVETPPAQLDLDPRADLDPARSRRFGRAVSFTCCIGERALGMARISSEGVGLVVSNAFGDVERSVRFLVRIRDHVPRLASPAEFPQLVLSALSGNASIYLGLSGPVLNTSDVETGAEAAFDSALSLLELGAAQAMLVSAVEVFDPIVHGILDRPGGWARTEGASAFVLETEDSARSRGTLPLARVLGHRQLQGPLANRLSELPAPQHRDRAALFTGPLDLDAVRALDQSEWAECPRFTLSPSSGFHEALGGSVLLAAVEGIRSHGYAEVLVVTRGHDVTFATHLSRALEAG